MPTVRYTTVNGRVIAEKRNGVRKLYRPDHLGSTIAMYDNTQTKSDTWVYWPYGAVRTRTGTTATPFQFVGVLGYFRDSSDRTYVRARTFRQTLGLWQTRDPLWPRQPEYGYLLGSPTRHGDPSGLLAMSITLESPRNVVWPDIPWQNVWPWIIGAGEGLGVGAPAIGIGLGIGAYIYGVGEALDWSMTLNPPWEFPPYPMPRPAPAWPGTELDMTRPMPMFILPQLELESGPCKPNCTAAVRAKVLACMIPHGCRKSDDCITLQARAIAGGACLIAKRNVDRCYGGVNYSGKDHSGSQAETIKAIRNCQDLMIAKNCWPWGLHG